MKALMLTSLFTISATTFAGLPEAHIKNLNFSYTAPTGSGKVEQIDIPSMDVAASLVDISASVDVANNKALLNFGGANIEMSPIPDLLKDLQLADIVSLVLNVTSSELNMSGTRVFYKTTKDGAMALENFRAKCLINNNQLPTYQDKILDYCTTDGDVYIGKFTSQSDKTFKSIAAALDITTNGQGKILESSEIRSINFDNRNHAMSGSVTIDGKTIRFWGGSWYMAEQKTLKIKMDRAKWGLFNITDRMFNELKQKESAKFLVQRPYLYLILD